MPDAATADDLGFVPHAQSASNDLGFVPHTQQAPSDLGFVPVGRIQQPPSSTPATDDAADPFQGTAPSFASPIEERAKAFVQNLGIPYSPESLKEAGKFLIRSPVQDIKDIGTALQELPGKIANFGQTIQTSPAATVVRAPLSPEAFGVYGTAAGLLLPAVERGLRGAEPSVPSQRSGVSGEAAAGVPEAVPGPVPPSGVQGRPVPPEVPVTPEVAPEAAQVQGTPETARVQPEVAPATEAAAAEPTGAATATPEKLQQAIDNYDYQEGHSGVPDLAAELETIDKLPNDVADALQKYREAEQIDREEFGQRSDLPDAAGEQLLATVRQRTAATTEAAPAQPAPAGAVDVSAILNAPTRAEANTIGGRMVINAKDSAAIQQIQNALKAWKPKEVTDASSQPSAAGVPISQVREGVGQKAPLRQPGETAPVQGDVGGGAAEPAPQEAPVRVADPDPHISSIANRFTAERVKAGQIGEIAPGQGFATEDLTARGLRMPPEQVNQHISDVMNNRGGNPIDQASAIRGEEARLSQRSNQLSRAAEANPRDLNARLAADNAFKDLTDFHNGPVAKLKNNWHAQGMAMQGEVPVDLSTYNGLREAWLKDTGKAPPASVEPTLRRAADRVKRTVAEENGAMQKLGQEIEKATARKKLPTAEDVRDSIRERMGLGPCKI